MSRRRLIAGVIAVVFLLVVILAAIAPFLVDDSNGQPPAATATATTVAGSVLPDITLADLGGEPVNLRSLSGSPLVLNYWYAACPPCEKELPAFAQVAAETDGVVRFVGVNTTDTADRARDFAASKGVTFEQLLDHTGRSVDAFRLTKFPSTVFVGADGEILQIVGHELDADELRTLIAEHFGS